MESTVKERLKSYLKKNNIKAVDFCNTIGVSSGFISGMRESIQPDKLKSIAINYPSIDIAWLMTGISSSVNSEPNSSLIDEIESLKQKLEESKKEILRLEGENSVMREQLGLSQRKNGKTA